MHSLSSATPATHTVSPPLRNGRPTPTLIPYFGADPFEQHPQLKAIWPAPSQALAQEATREALQATGAGVFCGNYLAAVEHEVVGMTGFFVTEEGGEPYLRWHGVVPGWRGQGLSAQMLALVVREVRRYLPQSRTLTELVPQTDYSGYLNRHFEKLGFKRAGALETFDWSPYQWQPWLLDLANQRDFARYLI